ncbi:MAG TPA: Uma2 family endonuclease [Roseiarcus sp.]|nr:Uma2 family endonuclease [Roseiarcus sp.]
MSADEFPAWAEGQEGRWELHDGAAVAMAPERVAHLQTKGEAYLSLRSALDRSRAPCEALPNGAAVRISERTVFEPDALVYGGPKLPRDAIEVPNPVIVVEVLSPSTAAYDHGAKLTGYFSLPSVVHYLILDADRRVVIHHKRGSGDVIETRILSDGALRLDPPGLEIPIADVFAL